MQKKKGKTMAKKKKLTVVVQRWFEIESNENIEDNELKQMCEDMNRDGSMCGHWDTSGVEILQKHEKSWRVGKKIK